jgi:hypothetical protein
LDNEDSKVLNPRKNLEEEYLDYEAKVKISYIYGHFYNSKAFFIDSLQLYRYLLLAKFSSFLSSFRTTGFLKCKSLSYFSPLIALL